MNEAPTPITAPRRRRAHRAAGLTVFDMVILSMFGAMMFATTYVMQSLPNIHLLGLFIVSLTVVYRWRALYPIYIFVFLNGFQWGFQPSWVPYLYIWTVLWAVVMLLPRRMPTWLKAIIYPAVSALHGFGFGILYAPAQALLFGYNWEQTIVWIATGFFTADIIHGVSNLCAGLLILPTVTLLEKLNRRVRR